MKVFATIVCLFTLVAAGVAKDEMSVADLVKKHLDSIGTEQARAAVKTRVVQGAVHFRVVNASSGSQDGKVVLVSEGNKLVSLLKLPNPSYHGERFVSDGNKTEMSFLKPGTYTELGEFVRVHNEILTEGLWGGALTTGWTLENLEQRGARLQYRGVKKTPQGTLHEVRYSPRKSSDLEISLYFEPETFRHVMTVYSLTISPAMGRTLVENARQQETRYRLEERFSDFKSTDGITLPSRWVIQFTPDVPEGNVGAGSFSGAAPLGAGVTGGEGGHHMLGASRNSISEFDASELTVSNNVTLDPKNFEVK